MYSFPFSLTFLLAGALSSTLQETFLHYDIIEQKPETSALYKRSFEQHADIQVTYKNVPLTLVVGNSNILSKRLSETSNSEVTHLAGYVAGIPGSLVRLSTSPSRGILSGLVTFGETNYDPLHIESIRKYVDKNSEWVQGKSIIYQLNDMTPEFRSRKQLRLQRRQRVTSQVTESELAAILLTAVGTGLDKAANQDPLQVPSREERKQEKSGPDSVASPKKPPRKKPTSATESVPSPKKSAPEPKSKKEAGPPQVVPNSPHQEAFVPQTPRQVAIPVPSPRSKKSQEPKSTPAPSRNPAPTPPRRQGCKVAIFADASFLETHSDEGEVKDLLEGLMNEVDGHFSDSSVKVSFSLDHVGLDSDGKILGNLSPDPNFVVRQVNEKIKREINPDDFCVIIVMTSIDLLNNAVGVGFIGTVCQRENNIAVITDNRDTINRPDLISIMTHELGHVFGSLHDGDGNECGNESEDSRFVMFNSVQSGSSNFQDFSPCSIRQISKTINSSPAVKRCVNGEEVESQAIGQFQIGLSVSSLTSRNTLAIDY